jgi:hypothetical protein
LIRPAKLYDLAIVDTEGDTSLHDLISDSNSISSNLPRTGDGSTRQDDGDSGATGKIRFLFVLCRALGKVI